MIYLDYAATTPIDEDVFEAYVKTSKNFFANTASIHRLGQESNYMYELATKEIQEILHVPNHNIVYTANATEANNLAIFGIVKNQKSGKIITSKIEHISVFDVMKHLENYFEVVYLDVDEHGVIDVDQLENELTKDTILVSLMWVNNIVGSIQKIDKVIDLVKKYPKTKLHVDAVQGLCKVKPNFLLSEIDVFTFSSHKIYGPKGIGGLIYKKNLILQKHLFGSAVQYGLKPGTFDLSLVVSTAKAFKKFYPLINVNKEYIRGLFYYLYDYIKDLDYVLINSSIDSSSFYVINISIPHMNNGETIVHYLEQNNICVSTGSACSSKQKKAEKTIYAITKDEKRAYSSIRISLSHHTTIAELNRIIESIKKIR